MGRFRLGNGAIPIFLRGYRIMVLETREEARMYKQKHFGYIAKRPDLKAEPHGWKSPEIVKVDVAVNEI